MIRTCGQRQYNREPAPSPLGEKRRRHYTAARVVFERIAIPMQRRCIMPAISKIGPKLAFCGVVSGLFLIGWAARHSVAQGPPQDSPSPPPPQATSSAKPAEAKIAAPQDPPETKSELAPALPELGPASAVADPTLNPGQNP